jgi:transposase
MRAPLKLKAVRGRQLKRLYRMYDQAECPRLRRRVQTVLLAQTGYETAELAEITRQSCWTVRRWLHRFLAEGLRSGRPREITPSIEWFLREALVKSPRDYGLAQPSGTTMLLRKVIKRQYKCEVSAECIRQHLHVVDGVCRRPTWTVRHRAEAQPGYAQKKAQFQGC